MNTITFTMQGWQSSVQRAGLLSLWSTRPLGFKSQPLRTLFLRRGNPKKAELSGASEGKPSAGSAPGKERTVEESGVDTTAREDEPPTKGKTSHTKTKDLN
jgi:hypothetical protein